MSLFAEFCTQFTPDDLPDVVHIGRKYFYDPKHLKERTKDWTTTSVGVYLGEEKRGFRPSSALIDLLAERNTARVVVNEQAAWLFLCGKDILMEGVQTPGEFKKGEPVIVSDMYGNVLGYGTIANEFNPSFENKPYVKNRLDKGEYLRRER